MVKLGGVRWKDGIGGVSAVLVKAGIQECEIMRRLVQEGELAKRKERGALSSTVVAGVKGVEVAGQLCKTGLWVGGYRYSVKRYVVVPPKRKEQGWRKVVGKVVEKMEEFRDDILDALCKGLMVDQTSKRTEEMVKEVRMDVRKMMRTEGVGPFGADWKREGRELKKEGRWASELGVLRRNLNGELKKLSFQMQEIGDMVACLLTKDKVSGWHGKSSNGQEEESDDKIERVRRRRNGRGTRGDDGTLLSLRFLWTGLVKRL